MPDFYCEDCEVTLVRDGKNRHIKTSKHKKNLERNKRNQSIFFKGAEEKEEVDTRYPEVDDNVDLRSPEVEELINRGVNVEITYSITKDGDKTVKFKF